MYRRTNDAYRLVERNDKSMCLSSQEFTHDWDTNAREKNKTMDEYCLPFIVPIVTTGSIPSWTAGCITIARLIVSIRHCPRMVVVVDGLLMLMIGIDKITVHIRITIVTNR
jgi:hypothetical protein